MANSFYAPTIETFGSDPANIQWRVVRGDTSALRIGFYQNDEETFLNTSTWSYLATAFNPVTKVKETISTTPGVGYVDLVAPSTVTVDWGVGYNSTVAEFPFDLQITISENGTQTVWTPVIGTIAVAGDITGGSL